jgi:hypothetical protein
LKTRWKEITRRGLPGPGATARRRRPRRDRDDDSALRGAVELGDGKPGDADRLAELLGLPERVLAEARVEHQEHLVRGVGVDALHDPDDLAELVHEVRLGVQAAGGVGDQHVDVPGARCFHRVVEHGRRIRAGGLRDDRHAVALGPDRQLLDRRGAEGVARGQHDLHAVLLEAMGELADGRGLAGAVHADHEHDVGPALAVDGERSLDGLQDLEQGAAQRERERLDVGELLAPHLAVQLAEDRPGGIHTDVGGKQARLELLEQLVVDLPAWQQVAEPRGALVDLRPQAREETARAGFLVTWRLAAGSEHPRALVTRRGL